MALSNPRIIFGIHSLTLYNRTTHIPYGPLLQVLGGASISLSGELVSLTGGSSRYEWSVEDGNITAELAIKSKELPNYLLELFLGKAPTVNAAEASGDVSGFANQNGTSVLDATTGIATVTATAADEADLKFGKYVVEAVSATTVDVYCMSDVDFGRGTDGEFEDNTMTIASAQTITDTGGVTALAAYGLDLTGGSGTVALVTGDTAVFYVRPQNSGSIDVDIGGLTDSFPSFGSIAMAQKNSEGEFFEVEAYKCKALGVPLGMEEKSFGEPEVTAKIVRDAARNKVLSIRTTKGL